MTPSAKRAICVVAIVKGDERFIEEWLIYHRLIGIDNFVVYDNDPELPLRSLLEPYKHFVTVIDWPGDPTADWPGRNLQTKTYAHALTSAGAQHEWVSFLDVDEFIVLRQHADLPAFLSSLGNCGSVRLNWHVFGHNGHYEDPEGLVTAALTRRMAAPSPRTKAITRPEAVDKIESAHLCRLKAGWRTVGPNGRPYSEKREPGQTDIAHINHYQCRSFLSWMRRVQRGDVSFDPTDVPPEHAWRLDEHLCLRQFVETVAKDKNEMVDEYMLRFEGPILEQLSAFSRSASPPADPPKSSPPTRRFAVEGERGPIPDQDGRRPAPLLGILSRTLGRIRSWRLWRCLARSQAGR